MDWFEAVILGLIQGLTEFLPVSSSGHLELGKFLFGIDPESNFYFSVAVHGATVLSTIVVLWKEILDLFKGFFKFRLNEEKSYICFIYDNAEKTYKYILQKSQLRYRILRTFKP